MVAMGCAGEGEGHNITGNTMWPATVVESQASINFDLGDRSDWRTAGVLCETLLTILSEPETFTGNTLIDDEYLCSRGWTFEGVDEAFACVKGTRPGRYLVEATPKSAKVVVSRGDVREVDKDKSQSKL